MAASQSGIEQVLDQDEALRQRNTTTTTTEIGGEQPNTTMTATRSTPASTTGKKQFAVSTQWEQQQSSSPSNGGTTMRHCDDILCCCATPVGHMHVLWAAPDGTPRMIAGPCWPFCMGVTVPLIVGIAGAVCYFLIGRSSAVPVWLLGVYIPCVVVVLVMLFCVSCRDPGLLERVTDEEAGQGGWFWNEQVGSYRPPGALYCRECGVLIEEYDHLCPWTGTGIGHRNMWAFKAFVVSVNILCYFSIGLLLWALLQGLALGTVISAAG